MLKLEFNLSWSVWEPNKTILPCFYLNHKLEASLSHTHRKEWKTEVQAFNEKTVE